MHIISIRKTFLVTVITLFVLAGCSPVEPEKGTTDTPTKTSETTKQTLVRTTTVPDFASIADVKAKKAAFFTYLQPAYDQVSAEIKAIRQQLQDWQMRGDALTERDIQALLALADFYKVKEESHAELISTLLQQIDVLPEALVFSQAANESGWGASRFAQQGYNFFGQWCFSKGCGIVPSQRTQGAVHEVAVFDSLAASVRSYHRNINRNVRYQALRQLRSEQRRLQLPYNACLLAQGLQGYSERKQAYVDELRAMMRYNRQYWRDNNIIDYQACEHENEDNSVG